MQLSIADQARNIYVQYIRQAAFEEIEHVPNDFIEREIVLEQQCLCLSYRFFDSYYPALMQMLAQQAEPKENMNWVCEMLLVMNGENGKAWNVKKELIETTSLDLTRQLRFNAAVCYKNKKSSSYYDYRLRVVTQLLKTMTKNQILALYEGETRLIKKILSRFFRNYYCWMYRNRLFSMCLQVCGEQLVGLEVQSLHKWIQNNPNDYSAYSRLIAIVRDRPSLAEKQILWLNELLDFCKVAYQQNQSYRHTETYMHYLTVLISNRQ